MNVQEIRERWSKATRGPWVADMRPVATECGECGEYGYEVPGVIRRKSDGCGIVDVQDSEKQNENAAAIASAPTDIAWLLDLVEQQQQQIEQLRLYRGCLECRHNPDGHKNSISCQGRNCVDFNEWQGVE